MNQKELKELIEFLIEKDIAEFELERGDVKVRIKRAADPAAMVMPETRYVTMPPPGGSPVGGSVTSAAKAANPAAACPPRAGRKSAYRAVAHRGHFLRSALARALPPL